MRVDDGGVGAAVTGELFKFERDEIDGGWVGSVPSLPGVMSQGDTLSRASDNLQEAVTGVLLLRLAPG